MIVWAQTKAGVKSVELNVIELCENGGIWEPVVVKTQQEKDYLLAMQLMTGHSFEVCLDGVDMPSRSIEPSWIHVPLGNQGEKG